MKKKKRHPIIWYSLYSLNLLPAILLWGLSPVLDELAVIIASIVVGIIGIRLSFFFTQLYKGCGIIGWITNWSLLMGGVLWAVLHLLHLPYAPITLFEVPCIALLIWLFRKNYIHPRFCHHCLHKRGGMRERHLLGDYSRYESYYMVRLTHVGAILVSVLVWALFLSGVDMQSRIGRYFYFYFPAALGIAIIFFETVRRWLIQQIIDMHEVKKSRPTPPEEGDASAPHTEDNTSVIRIIVIGQEKIYLVDNPGDENEPNSGSGLDVPLHHYIGFCTTREEEAEMARQTVQQEMGIANPNLRRLNSVTSEEGTRRVGHYILFLTEEELAKVDRYPGRWYTVEEIARLFHAGKLYPLFKEVYARFYTVVDTARTYQRNGQRRFPIREYKPAFTLRRLEQMGIEFDDPVWLYVSRYNEDRLPTRIRLWFQKVLRMFQRSTRCNA